MTIGNESTLTDWNAPRRLRPGCILTRVFRTLGVFASAPVCRLHGAAVIPDESLNELTFVAWLGAQTALWRQARTERDERPLIALGSIEDRQRDPATGRVKRCDMRIVTTGNRRLASGEFKRPEVPEGRDPRSESLRKDAHRKAIWGGVTYYFTCNMGKLVLFRLGDRAGEEDVEVREFELAPLAHSSGYPAYENQIALAWFTFLDFLEERLNELEQAPPNVTASDVIAIRNAIEAIVGEAVGRAARQYAEQLERLDELREEASQKFGFNPALDPRFPDDFTREIKQLLRFGVFVTAQKLLLYRVLQESGPRRSRPFRLDPLYVPSGSTDPGVIRSTLNGAWGHAIERSADFESAFVPQPLADLVFVVPATADEVRQCEVGGAWANLQSAIAEATWASISRNLVGFLYEMIVDPFYRHELGQFYTREDLVDVLTTFAVRSPADRVLDPASGGGSFLWSAYRRKRDLGDTHEQALESIWGFEITAFAAELSTITLATADTVAPAAYPRVALVDFFDVRPAARVANLEIPDLVGPPIVPASFDAVVGNPPYISYRRITNADKILEALADPASGLDLPRFSGKSDAYVWFLVHATRFLAPHGRLAFVVSSGILFSDYGIPLIRFIGRYFRIVAVIDSMVERWFAEADTNTVLLMLEREDDDESRARNEVRFVRLRRPLHRLVVPPDHSARRQSVEDLIEVLTTCSEGSEDPRFTVHVEVQGEDGGLELVIDEAGTEQESEDDEEASE